MTQPIPLPANGVPNVVALAYAERPYADGLPLPVSHGTNTWIPIPWDTDVYDPPLLGRPNGQHDLGGWTVVNGPCQFWGSAFVMVQGGYAGDSMHLMARRAKRINGVNTIIGPPFQAAEIGVLDHETHPQADGTVTYSNSHLAVPLNGILLPDERLQIWVDHWNGPAGTDARIVSAGVVVHYTPRPEDFVTPGGLQQ